MSPLLQIIYDYFTLLKIVPPFLKIIYLTVSFTDQLSNAWPLDDSGEPSQIPHGKFFILFRYYTLLIKLALTMHLNITISNFTK